ncbi:MAG: type IV secretion system protein [Alphaproteobacteria bacterium]
MTFAKTLRPTISLALISVFLLFALFVSPANAQGLDLDTCAGGAGPPNAYTSKVVMCVTVALIDASQQMAVALSYYMGDIATAMLALGTAWLGMQILGGEKQLTQKTVTFAIKIGVVSMFFFYTPQISSLMINILFQFLTLLNGPWTPWGFLDGLIAKFMGYGPSLVLAQGLLGILGATLMSSTTGIFLFMAGGIAILDLFLFLFNVVFTYLLAVMVMTFMLALTPMFAPLLLFYSTEKYFNKWWHIIVSAMLVPILMFTFLFFFLQIFNMLLADIFNVLGFPCSNPANLATCEAPDFSAYWKMNQPLFAWLMPADPNFSQQISDMSRADQLSTPAVQSNVNPFLRRAYNNNMMNVPGVNFGPNDVQISEQLVFALISLWIFASLMKSIITKIPNIADDIAGALNRITVESTQIENTIRKTTKMTPQDMQKTSANISENIKQALDNAKNMVGSKRGRQP